MAQLEHIELYQLLLSVAASPGASAAARGELPREVCRVHGGRGKCTGRGG